MTRFEYYTTRIRNDVASYILRIGLWVMPEGVIKERLLWSMDKALDEVIAECQRVIDNEKRSQ